MLRKTSQLRKLIKLTAIASCIGISCFTLRTTEAVLVSSSDTVQVSAQVGTIIPPVMGGGGLSFGYYPPVDPEIVFECSDGLDNDSDGFIDWGRDPNCLSNLGVAESEFIFENPNFPIIPNSLTPATSVQEEPDESFGIVTGIAGGYQWPVYPNNLAATPEDPWSLPMPPEIILYPIVGLLVLPYQVKPKRGGATLMQWLLLIPGAFPIVAAVVLYPSLYTVSLSFIFSGFAILRYTTKWW